MTLVARPNANPRTVEREHQRGTDRAARSIVALEHEHLGIRPAEAPIVVIGLAAPLPIGAGDEPEQRERVLAFERQLGQ